MLLKDEARIEWGVETHPINMAHHHQIIAARCKAKNRFKILHDVLFMEINGWIKVAKINVHVHEYVHAWLSEMMKNILASCWIMVVINAWWWEVVDIFFRCMLNMNFKNLENKTLME